jgi:glycosyltransferase involved in cell wall biosynthesis
VTGPGPAAAGSPATKTGRVHLVYPHGARVSTPYAIGRELGRRLEARYEVIYHDWSELGVIQPEPGDVLVGHPHSDPRTIFRRSIRQPGWRRRLMLAPFLHGDLRQVAYEDPIVPQCDLFLAITGPYWFSSIEASPCSHWRPKMVHLDLAIDRGDFPPIKTAFAPAGRRRFVYIGRTGRSKGTPYLAEIAARVPEVEFAWIGNGSPGIPGLTALGQVDFGSQAGRLMVTGFDFMLTVGQADANPTTILEAMAWGLVPVCTPTSGYEGIPSVVNVPLGDAAGAAAIVRDLVAADDAHLCEMQSANWRLLDEHYTWDRFAAQVIEAIESDASPPLLHESIGRRLLFLYYDLTSPYGRLAWSRPGRFAGRVRPWPGLQRRRLAERVRRRRGDRKP